MASREADGEATRDVVIRGPGAADVPPVLVDADALNALAAAPAWPHPAHPTWVLTPHPGEMGRLAGVPVADVQARRLALARDKAREWGVVLVLKGAPSIIATPDGVLVGSGGETAEIAPEAADHIFVRKL